MQIETQAYLDLLEETHKICFFDIEATGLRGDYNSILCISVKPYGLKPVTFKVERPGHDRKVLKDAVECLESFHVWTSYYGRGFDIPMINTRRLRWGDEPVDKRPHLDLYFSLKAKLLTARKSQGHLLAWLGTPESKMTVSATVWSEILAEPAKHMPMMIKRCESDCAGLEALYKRTKHLIAEISR